MDFSVLKNHPWNELITRARLGDTAAILALCELAEPVIKQYCRVPFFVRWLGREEVRSLAALAVLEFIMENPSVPRDSEVPCALKKVIKCQLLNRIKRLKIEDRHMYSAPSAGGGSCASPHADDSPQDLFVADEALQPENRLLQKDHIHQVQDAVKNLTPLEQRVIHACFYEGKSTTLVAQELHCTPQAVRRTRSRAFTHLRTRIARPG